MDSLNARPDIDSLVDIRNVNIEMELTREERVKSFVDQIKDPYCFKVGTVVVNVSYSDSGATLNDRFVELLSIL